MPYPLYFQLIHNDSMVLGSHNWNGKLGAVDGSCSPQEHSLARSSGSKHIPIHVSLGFLLMEWNMSYIC